VNTGVDFPGLQFEVLMEKTYRQYDRSNTSTINFYYDIFVVEVSNAENKFIFKFNKNPGELGKCE
jgi:hypothetical protein